MSDDVVLKLEERKVLGKGVKQLRRDGLVPGVIHDHGKESMHVQAPYREVAKAFELAGKHQPVELKLGQKQHMAIIKDVDFEPTKRQMRHIVFNAIKQNEEIETEIPLKFVGDEIPAEKVGLMVLQSLTHVTVKALPKDLPDEFEVDLTTLAEVGDRITIEDLKVPAGVTITSDPETPIAVVEMPRDQIAEADAAAAELAADAEQPEAEAVEAQHGEDTPQDTQAPEDQPGGKKQFEPKGE